MAVMRPKHGTSSSSPTTEIAEIATQASTWGPGASPVQRQAPNMLANLV
jgi:hypothetical protein